MNLNNHLESTLANLSASADRVAEESAGLSLAAFSASLASTNAVDAESSVEETVVAYAAGNKINIGIDLDTREITIQ